MWNTRKINLNKLFRIVSSNRVYMTDIVRIIFRMTIIFLFLMSNSQAGGNHGGESRKKPQKIFSPIPLHSKTLDNSEQDLKGDLLNTLFVDGYEVIVKVADVEDSVPDGGSHNILVKIKLGNKIQRNTTVKANVVFPDNTSKVKSFLALGDWYLAGYNLGQKGKHQISISFEDRNSEKKSGNISYP